MVELFSRHEYFRQITRFRWLVTQPTALLYLASLEETRKEKEKPDSIGRQPRPRLCLEQNTQRWLGNCAESYFEYHHYLETPETARLSILDRCLHRTQPITLRTAEYVTRTFGGVRGALRQLLAEPSTRLPDVFILVL